MVIFKTDKAVNVTCKLFNMAIHMAVIVWMMMQAICHMQNIPEYILLNINSTYFFFIKFQRTICWISVNLLNHFGQPIVG